MNLPEFIVWKISLPNSFQWDTGKKLFEYLQRLVLSKERWLLFCKRQPKTIKWPLAYVSLRLRVQNRRKKWNFPLNFRTMRKLSDLYSRIFQTQSSGCASGVDLFRNFTKLKILNIWIVKYLLNCKRYLSYNFRIFQKNFRMLSTRESGCASGTDHFRTWILKFSTCFLQFSEHTEISTWFFTVFRTCWKFQHAFL